jgi:hypothetical protein
MVTWLLGVVSSLLCCADAVNGMRGKTASKTFGNIVQKCSGALALVQTVYAIVLGAIDLYNAKGGTERYQARLAITSNTFGNVTSALVLIPDKDAKVKIGKAVAAGAFMVIQFGTGIAMCVSEMKDKDDDE